MSRCPQCDAEVAEGKRFCPNCGARQPEPGPAAAAPADSAPEPPTAGETVLIPPADTPAAPAPLGQTVVLPQAESAPTPPKTAAETVLIPPAEAPATARLDDQPPAAGAPPTARLDDVPPPATGETVLAPPAARIYDQPPQPSPFGLPPSPPPAGQNPEPRPFGLPPAPPPSSPAPGAFSLPPTDPAGASGPPQPSTQPTVGSAPASYTLPGDTPPAPPAPARKGCNIWVIVGVVLGVLALACIAAVVGGFLWFQNTASTVGTEFGTAFAATAEALGAEVTVVGGDTQATIEALGGDTQATIEALGGDTQATIEALGGEATSVSISGGSGEVLLSEDFTSESSSVVTAGSSDVADYRFESGAYVIDLREADYIVWEPLDDTYGDIAAQVEATIDGPAENGAALIFRLQDDANFYIYSITGDGRYGLEVYQNGEPTTLVDWTEAAAIRQGDTNTLGLELVGSTIRLLVNGELLTEVTDSTFGEGQLAIGVNTFEQGNTAVRFDNLTVESR